MNKYLSLKRSQIVIALYAHERELLQIKAGSTRDATLRARRAELLAALQIKDQELIDKWNKSGYPA